MTDDRVCERCTVRPWLLRRLAAHLGPALSRIDAVLSLPDDELIAALAPQRQDELRAELRCYDPGQERARARAAGIERICRCDPEYPATLRVLGEPPAVLHVKGGLERFLELVAEDPIAVVGARRSSPYGQEVARALARELGAAGLTVVSGMAFGIDSAAHSG